MMAKLLARWLLLASYGPTARFDMTTAWIGLILLVVVDAVWLSLSRLSFAETN